MHLIMASVECLSLPHFSTLSHKRHDFLKRVFKYKMCFDFLYDFSQASLTSKEFGEKLLYMCLGLLAKYPLVLLYFNETLIFVANFWKKYTQNNQISNFLKICIVGNDLFHVCGRTEGQVDVMKLIVFFEILRMNLNLHSYLFKELIQIVLHLKDQSVPCCKHIPSRL
jgi:hypothetical protein